MVSLYARATIVVSRPFVRIAMLASPLVQMVAPLYGDPSLGTLACLYGRANVRTARASLARISVPSSQRTSLGILACLYGRAAIQQLDIGTMLCLYGRARMPNDARWDNGMSVWASDRGGFVCMSIPSCGRWTGGLSPSVRSPYFSIEYRRGSTHFRPVPFPR